MTWIILLWIFQGYSLFSYQCSLLFLATQIYYHNHLCLSTTFLFCFASFSKQFVVTRLRQLVNNTKPSFVCQQLFSSFHSMNVRITYPDSLPIHLNIDVRHKYFPCGEYYTNIIFFYCQHTFFIFYTYLEWNFKFHIYAEFSLSLFLDLSYDFNISYLQ